MTLMADRKLDQQILTKLKTKTKRAENTVRKDISLLRNSYSNLPINSVAQIYALQNGFSIRAKLTKDEKAALSDTLRVLSSMNWSTIGQQNRHKNGYEIIKKQALKRNPPDIVTDDNNIIAFRFYDRAPMVGFRILETFYVVWLDRGFKLYKHGS